MSPCIFCGIVDGTVPSYKVWESDTHVAFLSIFPNTEGVTVVIPKKHYPSYVFALPDDVLSELVLAAKKVAHILDEKLDDVGRTAMVFEGFGVDHIHAKLFPMHGTANMAEWKPIESSIETYFETYPGYISSHDAALADPETLDALARRLRG
ncbi:MAG: HIT family protein [Candidatus Yonathbacteria bacterium]|nr:HIT family protein [Candidatus Yonathbacteria bacterium]